MSLIEKLTAALDETEQRAQACSATDWRIPEGGHIVDRDVDGWASIPDAARIFSYWDDREAEAVHVVNNDPDFVLRQVAAHRKLLELAKVMYDDHYDNGADHLIEALADIYGIEVE